MGDDGSSQMGYQQHSGESMLNCPSSSMNTRPVIMNPGYCSGWDPMVSLGQSADFGASSMVNYPSDFNHSELSPKLSMFGSGNIHELVNPFVLPGGSQNPNALYLQSSVSRSGMDEKPPLMYNTHGERRSQISEGRTVGVSPNSKRKRDCEPKSPVTKAGEGDLRNDHSCETLGTKEQDDNRHKSEQNTAANLSGKQGSKQVKDNSQDEDASKQDYIHVRARRGQATNSHSLAERVRREKISERMRLLQELVPGCNKITGKAVMLDEIINYVQSLQQQVEFLSMKLATVNPELNFDFERLLSKEILHSRGATPPVLGFDQGMSSAHGFPQGIHQTLTTMPNIASQYHHTSQAVWDGDLQSLLQMGFDPNASVNCLGPNGNSKTEL